MNWSRPCFNRVTVSAADYAFRNLTLCLLFTAGVAHIEPFISSNVVKMQRHGMRLISAVYASVFNFVFVEPSANCGSTGVVYGINPFTVTLFLQTPQAPIPTLLWVTNSLSWLFVCLCYLVRIFISPSARGFNLPKAFVFRVHNWIISFNNACKPDIFDTTYEAVQL